MLRLNKQSWDGMVLNSICTKKRNECEMWNEEVWFLKEIINFGPSYGKL